MNSRKLNHYRVLGKSKKSKLVVEHFYAFDREQVERMFERNSPRHRIVRVELEKRCSNSVIDLDDYKEAEQEHLSHLFDVQIKKSEQQWKGAFLRNKMLEAVKSQKSLLQEVIELAANPIVSVWG